MAKYGWLLVLAGLIAIMIFNNVLVPAKTNLASIIKLEPFPKPVTVKQTNREVLIAKIFSSYPLNHRSFLTLAAGAADGVRPGMVVTADGNHLLGQVTEVFERSSNVRTIFDQDWSLSARVGPNATDALFVSGQQPRLTMIDKKAELNAGDLVYSASRDFPYGLKIGSVKEILDSGEVSFRQATLDLPFDINDLKETVIILK